MPFQAVSGPLHHRGTDRLHYHLGPVRSATYDTILADERSQQDRERVRLLYVACTRAAELLAIPHLSDGNSGWLGLVDLGVDGLPPIDLDRYDPELPAGEPDQKNRQDRDSFAAEAERIVQSTRPIQWRQPSRHEMSDEEAAHSEAAAAVFVEEEAGRPEILGGPIRGTVLHKLMQEVLTDEIADDVVSLEARSPELLSQLGETPAEDPAKGIVPSELAQVVVNTFALPEISALRDRLTAEFPVFGHQVEADRGQTEIAVSGIVDPLALDPDGKIETIVDWKSDVSPTNTMREKYKTQVRAYLEASGAARGLIVYMTIGLIDQFSVR